MEEENPGNTFTPPPPQEELSVKRKRGRPRKDQSEKREKKSRTVNDDPKAVSNNNDDVGQEVTGVVNAAFDAGYLITVRVGNTGTVFSGVVFKPGNYIPLSSEIDVAPNVQMITRNETPSETNNEPRRRGRRPKQRYDNQFSEDDDDDNGSIPGNGEEELVVLESGRELRNGEESFGAKPSNNPDGKLEEMDENSDTVSAEPLQIVHSDSISSRSSNMGRMCELLQVLQRENEDGKGGVNDVDEKRMVNLESSHE